MRLTALEQLDRAHLIFFDPDQGLDTHSVRKGNPQSPKYIFLDEIAATFTAGHSVLIYQHFIREVRDRYLKRRARELAIVAPGSHHRVVLAGDTAFFLLVDPRHEKEILHALDEAIAKWDSNFITVEPLYTDR
jgi:hypothetical protein